MNNITNSSRKTISHRSKHDRRAAWTLLEVVLAIALSVVVLAAINTALETYYKGLTTAREMTERDQLARVVTRRIADDVRGAVRYEEFDASGLQTMMSALSLPSSSSLGGSSGGTSGGSGGTSGNSSSGNNSSGSGGNSSGNSSNSNSGNSGGSNSSTGSGGSSGSSNSSSGNSSSNSSGSGGSSGSSGGASSSDTTSDTTTTESSVRQIPGIYGNETMLQIDVCRIPRLDEFSGIGVSGQGGVGDVRSVTYFVNAPTAGQENNVSGLIRLERVRAAALYASQNGVDESNTGVALAPEVVSVKFEYSDGVSTYTEWDSTVTKSLPRAIIINLEIAPPQTKSSDSSTSLLNASAPAPGDKNNEFFRVVINPPAWACSSDTGTSTGEDSSNSSDTSNSNSSSQNSSGTSGNSSSGGTTGGTSSGTGGSTGSGTGGGSKGGGR